jgi:uncharacterized protein YkwD
VERGVALSRVRALLFVLVAASPVCTAGADDVLGVARDVRRNGCEGHPGTAAPLRADAGLDRAAREWSASGDLGAALIAARVRVRASASLALLRTARAELPAALRQRLCTPLTDPTWTRLGSLRRDGDVWIVLAVPSTPPSQRDAAAVGAEVLRLSNALRARGARCGTTPFAPAPPLTWNKRLTAAGRVQATEMARFGVLTHTGRDGSTPARRAERAGYAWRAVGENVAAGAESAAEVMEGWEHSPEHCRNLLDPTFTELGLGFATSPRADGHSTWWSMVLARPRG